MKKIFKKSRIRTEDYGCRALAAGDGDTATIKFNTDIYDRLIITEKTYIVSNNNLVLRCKRK